MSRYFGAPTRRLRRGLLVAVAVAVTVPLVLSGCTPTAGTTSGKAADAGDRTYALVVHSVPGDPFWDVVKSGAEAAATSDGATITYQGNPDPQKQSQLIETAIADKVDGIIVSMANPEGVQGAIADAVAAKIPVITINSGSEQSAAFGAMTHVGQSEFPAGQGAGKQFNDAGVQNLICIVHEAGNKGLEDRCAGATDSFGGTVKNIQVDVANIADAQNTIKSALLADPSIDSVLTLNPAIAVAASQAVAEAASTAQVGTFDVSSDVTSLIEEGKILFAIDQQPYLQGYLPVTFFGLYWSNGNVVGGGAPVYSGPGFITKENAAQVAEYAVNGTR
ncbi:substrate-binding domain-containing protein [Cryobacterium psychrophilum]|uniref:Sugar ABC transporter substrate-binding protein n=1 Tax=Cryobacterium psychrophilum TaxID=41988 RepID=A0A4Y8KRW1_9MICO|nr:substrate-binding domain-containing protein [Cryobacterium psychrophilum]TDW29420.1 monosaccharide ABC transporter substrate-binding protein (CUT2 family) [Cryobacterium psychrophilum]TFD81437.1 sugar ABC transporter substrate-binding protein [Cryobacterium psychrophilum]